MNAASARRQAQRGINRDESAPALFNKSEDILIGRYQREVRIPAAKDTDPGRALLRTGEIDPDTERLLVVGLDLC